MKAKYVLAIKHKKYALFCSFHYFDGAVSILCRVWALCIFRFEMPISPSRLQSLNKEVHPRLPIKLAMFLGIHTGDLP